MPGAKSQSAMSGVSGAQMSSGMLMQLLNMQAQPSNASDAATRMISDLDSDGDGALSLEEATASGSSKAAEAFGALDIDGDGSLTSTELASSLEAMGPPPGGDGGPPPGGPPPGGPPPSSGMASDVLSSFDSDEDGGISLSEVLSATESEESDETTSAFASLDTDGDGKLSLAELTAALDQYLQTNTSRFASNAEATAA